MLSESQPIRQRSHRVGVLVRYFWQAAYNFNALATVPQAVFGPLNEAELGPFLRRARGRQTAVNCL